MVARIITDRLEVEKMATDSFVLQNGNFGWIERNDIIILNRLGTYRLAFLLKFDMGPDWTESLIQEIKSLSLPFEKLKGCIMNLIVDKVGESHIKMTNIYSVLGFIREYTRNEFKEELDQYLNILWTTQTNPSLPANTLQVNLIFTTEKTEEDKLVDEKHREIMIESFKKRWYKD